MSQPEGSESSPSGGAGDTHEGTSQAAIALAAGVVVVLLGLGLLWWGEPPPSLLERGGQAPGFSLPELGSGETVSLTDFRGRAVLVNFWATWCRPCEEEIPAMGRLYEGLRSDGFEILAISVDEDAAAVERFRDRLGIEFTILLDPAKEISQRYQTTGFPESLLVDSEGQVVERYIGPRDWDHPIFARRIREVMAGAADS